MCTTHWEEKRSLELLVRAMVWEADGVVSVHLEKPDHSELPKWEPGAHIDLLLPGMITRQYSLSGDPHDRRCWRITVLRELVSKGGSAAVHTVVRPGNLVHVRGPRNHFPLISSPAYLFIAGGIGITPILPMVKSVAASTGNWRLFYGGRRRASMAFLSELLTFGDRVTLCPEDEVGRINLCALLDRPCDNTAVYCCGPEALLQDVEAYCATWPTHSLHIERFKAAVPNVDRNVPFEVVCAGSGVSVKVDVGMSILDAVESVGIFPPHSCREGTCGTCETRVLGGLPEHRDSVLSNEERESNETMIICVGRAMSAQLILDL